ncbi:MAG: amino acid adenylation domain-containing protein [Candidatus Rhabdochlamydia sp.]
MSQKIYPNQLSQIQKRLWYATKLDDGWATYNQPMTFILKGKLNIKALEIAFQVLVDTHPELRTAFPEKDGQPLLQVQEKVKFKLYRKNFTDFPRKDRLHVASQFLKESIREPISLDESPLMRVALVDLDKEEWLLLLNWHYLIIDGHSISIFLKQLSELYNNYPSIKKSPFLKEAQMDPCLIDHSKGSLDFWKKTLAGTIFSLELPKTSKTPQENPCKGNFVTQFLDPRVGKKLCAFIKAQKTSPFRIMITAFAVLLYRYTKEEDFVIGYPVDLRPKELNDRLGIFINNIPMRFQIDSQSSFISLLHQTAASRRSAKAHQEYSYDQIVKATGGVPSHLRQPLFNVSFTLENYSIKDFNLNGIFCEELFLNTGTAKFDLSLMIFEEKGSIRLYFEFPSSLFSKDSIERLGKNFQVLLNELLSHPDAPVGILRLLTESEYTQVLRMGTGLRNDYPRKSSVPELFEKTVKEQGSCTALSSSAGILHYNTLNKKANQLARYLQTQGIKKGDLVGLALERCPNLIIGMLGILKAGAVYVPIDESYPMERKLFMIEDSELKILLTQKSFRKQFSEEKITSIISLDAIESALSNYETSDLSLKIEPDDLFCLNYTSGSTGKPKGVEICHRGVVRLVKNTDWISVSPNDRFLNMANISFDAITYEVWGSLLNGACLCIYPSGALTLEELKEFIEKEHVTSALFAARLFTLLADEDLKELQGMKEIFSGGDVMSADAARKFSLKLPACRIVNAYGPTENTVISTYYLFRSEDLKSTTIPIGRPIANTDVFILDNQMQLVPIGATGELVCAGDGVARGYWHRSDLSAEKFVQNPYSDLTSRMYRTGDLARFLPNGNIEFLGRIDNQVKIRGFRIELGEIEETIKHHADVIDCVVLVHKTALDDKCLVAYLESKKGGKLNSEEVRTYIASKLPTYMLPSFFVILEKFPVTPNGKVDRKALPPPEIEKKDKQRGVPLQTPTEKAIGALWSNTLSIENVQANSHFFKIGGDSIHAMRFISQLKKDLNIRVSVGMLFQYPVLMDFAAQLDSQKGHSLHKQIPKRQQHSPIPLSLNQEALWFIDQLYPLSPLYMIVLAFCLKGQINPGKLKKSLNSMVQRHEILRTRFVERQQWIEDLGRESFIEVDLSQEKNAEEKGLSLLQEQICLGMNLSQLPLFQILLVKIKEDLHFGLLRVHHIIFDGESIAPFFKEWMDTSESQLDLPIQYGDFSMWQREYLETEEAFQHLQYWKNQLQDAPEFLELPLDKPRPPIFSGKGEIVQFQLSRDLTDSLNRLAKNQGVTLFVLGVAAFQVLLLRYTGKEDILIGTPFANRERSELHHLIGYFVQMCVIRSNLSGNPSFLNFLQQVHQTVSEAFKNVDMPFEKIVSELNPTRNPSYNPIFQVGFALENISYPIGELISLEGKTAKFDLNMTIRAKGKDLICCIEYCSDLFERETIDRMLNNFLMLLKSFTENPEEQIGYLPILTPQELHQITVEWNETSTSYPKNQSIVFLFEEIVNQYPNHIALRFQNQTMTYKELNKKANQLAHHLKKIGVKKQEFVGIYLEQSIDLIMGILAILKTGAVYVPLDASYPMERKLFMIQDTKLQVLLTQESLVENFPQKNLNFLFLDREKEFTDHFENLKIEIDPTDLAYINYTSGSTGNPKGVEVCHRGVVRLVKNTNWMEIHPEDRISQISNISFDAVTFEIWGALLNGATLCIYPFKDLSPDELGKFLVLEKITHLCMTSRLFTLMVDERLDCLKGLKKITPGGDVLSPYHAKIAVEALAPGTVINIYGPTENTTLTTAYPICDLDAIKNGVPIGTPISNSTAFILDRNNKPVPIGVHGELCTGGDGLARGYLNQKELTEEKFIPNPFGAGRLYKTGDLVKFLPDGNIAFLGRTDQQVKIRGFRIELGEIEDVLRHYHKVSDCVILAREDVPGEKLLVAYIEPKEGNTIEDQEIAAYSAEKLPKYMLPSFFLVLEKFPVGPTGKINRKALPSPTDILEKREFEAPLTSREKLLADIWSQVLKIRGIGRKDHFFRLGGHSISAAQLSSIVNKTFECSIPVNLIFEESVLERYAQKVDQFLSQGDQKTSISSSELFWVWRNRESILDSSITPEGTSPKSSQFATPKSIFLTGATGFVGAFVLRELLEKTKAKIYCHARAKTETEAMARIKEVMEKYLLWKPQYTSHLIPVPGDLEKKNLGMAAFDFLADEIDSIFHIGAYVNHALPYQRLKAANVLGVQEVIRLACKKKTKPLHYISTIAVIQPIGGKWIEEDVDIRHSKNLFNGYAQSKWVGEKLVLIARSRGLPTNIYRLSRVSGDSRTGSGPTGDFLWRVVQASIRLKMAPEINYKEEVTPIDYVAETIRLISTKKEGINHQYNVLNPESYGYKDIFKLLIKINYPITLTDFLTWRQALVKEAIKTGEKELTALMALVSEIDLSQEGENISFSCKNTTQALKDSSVQCPKVDEKLFLKYIDYYVSIGFLPPYRSI